MGAFMNSKQYKMDQEQITLLVIAVICTIH